MPSKPKTPFKPYMALSYDMYPSAGCTEAGCGWEVGSSPATLADTKVHCGQTGHEVQVTRINASFYKGEARA